MQTIDKETTKKIVSAFAEQACHDKQAEYSTEADKAAYLAELKQQKKDIKNGKFDKLLKYLRIVDAKGDVNLSNAVTALRAFRLASLAEICYQDGLIFHSCMNIENKVSEDLERIFTALLSDDAEGIKRVFKKIKK